MTMVPEQRFQNVVASVQAYLNANWKDGMADPLTLIVWHDGSSNIDDTSPQDVTEWIEPLVLEGPRQFRRQTKTDRFGAEAQELLNVNIFQRREQYETDDPMRMILLRDTLQDLFLESRAITFSDYADPNDPKTLGVINSFGAVGRKMPMDAEKGLYQYNVTASLRVTLEWAR